MGAGVVPAPLFRDPVYDGAADPVVIYNHVEKAWWMLYTNRRAGAPGVGQGWIHGTDIGIAESRDGGTTWLYRGICEGLSFERGTNTYWAPEVVYHEGVYHMYVSYVRGIPTDWNWGRKILHYTSRDMWDWHFESELVLSSDKVIDAAVFRMPDGMWRMWYKDEAHESHTWAAQSADLYHWDVVGEVISDCAHEGPNVFRLGGTYWMITDEWHGMGVYHSDDLLSWEKQDSLILDRPGTRTDDGTIANHADVVTCGGRAYIFYFTHPERGNKNNDEQDLGNYRLSRSSIQAAELIIKNGRLTCDRDAQFELELDETVENR
jgi:beta-xylosidase